MPTRFRRVLACGTAALILSTITTAATPPATAAPELVAPDMPPEVIAEYRKHHPDVPVADLYARLRLMPARKALLDQFIAEEATFGGSWYDMSAGVWNLYGTTPDANAAMAARARAVGITPATKVVSYSVAALHARAERIRKGQDPLSKVSRQAGVDVAGNRVQLAAAAKDRTVNDPMVTYVDPAPPEPPGAGDACTTRRDCGTPLRSGIIMWRSSYAVPSCSLGFVAAGTDGSKWVLTAGHCLQSSATDTWGNGSESIGTAGMCWHQDGADSGNRCIGTDDADFGRIRITNNDWLSGSVGGYVFNPTSPSTPVDIDSAMTNSSQLEAWDVVCIHGWHTSHTGDYSDTNSEIVTADNCGIIYFTSSPHNYYMPVVKDVDVCKGDSGGAWLMYPGNSTRMAVGLHQGRPYHPYPLTPLEPPPGEGESTPYCNEEGYARFTRLDRVNAHLDAYSGTTIRVITR